MYVRKRMKRRRKFDDWKGRKTQSLFITNVGWKFIYSEYTHLFRTGMASFGKQDVWSNRTLCEKFEIEILREIQHLLWHK